MELMRAVLGRAGIRLLVFAIFSVAGLAATAQNSTLVRGGGFTLTDHAGRVVSDEDFRGQYMLIYFGYTHCPDVCPTGLSVLTHAMQDLGAAGNRVQPLFVTFDPKRDTVEVLADYVIHFHPRLLGLTGSREQTLAATNAYGVDVSSSYLANRPEINYSMSHSAFTYLVGPDGRLRSMYREGIDGKTMAAAILKHLEQ